MRRLKFTIALLASLIWVGQIAMAREPSGAEKQELERTVIAFEKAISAKDMTAVFDALPPRVFAFMASKAGQTVAEFKVTVGKLASKAVGQVSSFELDEQAIEFHALANGTPYALIPTITFVKTNDGKSFKFSSPTLAILDDGKWYLLRVSDPKLMMILQAVYPDFVGVEFPRGTMERLKG